MDSLPNFTPASIEMVRELFHRIYGETIEIQLVDSELVLNPKRAQRVGCQFFYAPDDQPGTGRKEYDSLEQYVTTLLQAQADHERDHSLS